MSEQPFAPCENRFLYPGEHVPHAHDDVAWLRGLSLAERGRLIQAACRLAAEIYRSRRRSGLTDVQPATWPKSTLEFLRKHAANAQS